MISALVTGADGFIGSHLTEFLVKKGFITTIRSTRGDDIMAACGQLVGQVQDRTSRKKRINQQIESLNLNAQ